MLDEWVPNWLTCLPLDKLQKRNCKQILDTHAPEFSESKAVWGVGTRWISVISIARVFTVFKFVTTRLLNVSSCECDSQPHKQIKLAKLSAQQA